MDQSKTPLYNQLAFHSNKHRISLHVPGHKYGQIFPESAKPFYNELLKLDATELAGLDDLHSPEGVILEAETLLSQLYAVKKSYFLVNGSTVGNLAMIMATLTANDTVLVQRNCHKSILNGLELTGAKAVFLGPDYHAEWAVLGGVSSEVIQKAMKAYPEAKAVILTYPNYYGMVNELEEIIKLAHSRNMSVLVDEAHGTHFISGGSFPRSAVQLGADIVVQSAHKTLPAMTMGSFLHFNSERISIVALEKYLHILQSSSPSYPIMASLDLARSYLGTYTIEDHLYLSEQIKTFRERLKQLDGIRVLEYDDEGDLLKVTLQTLSQYNGFQLQTAFEQQGIYTELADPHNVLLVLPLLKENTPFPFQQIVEGIHRSLKDARIINRVEKVIEYIPVISKLVLADKEMKQLQSRKVSFIDAVGEVCAEKVIPYPPGIPILFPGELITAETVEQLAALVDSGARFQGTKHIFDHTITIFTKK
ncbi:aminotransferase class I/II-fold pyridoxal phosphate-dependent enzyme [Bacillus tuaregi]|uniref:aminotransferase class I/II-fold pyridoxal phosphate-dependent enzyme n=1 Tax=Bacillus tuaregi TaxID=1816695 RepID=UPI0008F8C0AF|nr:aminotransferase class I/II-fold pyridoxal phosphate-dependent enzyme [Bacillus tuaregi]